MKKNLQGRSFVSSDKVKVASQEALREVAKNDLTVLSEVIRMLEEVYRHPR